VTNNITNMFSETLSFGVDGYCVKILVVNPDIGYLLTCLLTSQCADDE